MKTKLTEISLNHPGKVITLALLITAFFLFQFPSVVIDTDPENMLPADEQVRVDDRKAKEDFDLYDFIVLGINSQESGFTPELLNKLTEITAEIEDIEGVISDDIIAPSVVDDISQGANGSIIIKPLVGDSVRSQKEADEILFRISQNKLLRGKLASPNGDLISIFIPIESKDLSHRISEQLKLIAENYGIGEDVFIAGLPVAEDSFGKEMFIQMGLSAPVAMLFIFVLMLIFFKKAKLVVAPLIISMMTVIWTMGLLIVTGNTVHIMSSMIPIFLIPISVLDSIHILSEFHDNLKKQSSKDLIITETISELFVPMLYTSLTTAVGFLSLSLTPIPPVQVFGMFVAVGVLFAWALSITVIPALLKLISTDSLKKFSELDEDKYLLNRVMKKLKQVSVSYGKVVIVLALFVIAVSAYGLNLIIVNDNPVKWFKESHPIRIADKIMNQRLAGTYINFLTLDGMKDDIFKSPEAAKYVEKLQEMIEQDDYVGATTSYADIVKKVRFELFEADSAKASLPDSRDEIAQLLFLFEMSGGDADDLYKLVTQEFDKANIWIQLKKGDNQIVSASVDRINKFIEDNPPPVPMEIRWAGLPYINVVWQDKMVSGMKDALSGSFLVVFIMMVILFRSFKWGVVSLLPLSLTILSIYAFIGFIGKPYDMPVAILSSLTLGLSVDFAIHFIQRLRKLFKEKESFNEAFDEVFKNTGKAIGRNVVVIAIGFIPMLFSSLSPYVTVGTFFLAIMLVSGLTTMVLLPSIVYTFQNLFYEKKNA